MVLILWNLVGNTYWMESFSHNRIYPIPLWKMEGESTTKMVNDLWRNENEHSNYR